MNIFNKNGFTTTELLIALAITSTVGLGGAYLLSNVEKNKYTMSTNTGYMALEKTIEGYLTSPRGCGALKDLPIGSEDIEFQLGGNDGPIIKQGAKFGDITITGLRIASFASLDPESTLGMAQVELLLYKDKADHGAKRVIPVAVNVENNTVTDCNFSHTKAFTDLMNKACYQAYGLPAGTTCDQVREALMNAVVESICTDLYGGGTPVMEVNTAVGNGRLKYCNLNFTHAGQDCGAKYAQGFKANGQLNCVSAFATSTPVCTTWSAWSPDPSTKCVGQNFTQTRTCTAGASGTDSQGATGTKAVTYSYTPGPPANYCSTVAITKKDNCGSAPTTVYGTKPASDPSCAGSCPSGNKFWGPGNACTDFISGSGTVTLNDNDSGYTGKATYSCSGGAWTLQSGSTCNAPCTFNSTEVLHNASVTAYKHGTDSYGNDICLSESRKCTDGSLSGSYTLASCTPAAGPSGPSGPSGSGSCFVAGTKVTMWDGSQRAIETLMAGELIQTFNESTGEMGFAPITATLHHKSHESSGILFTFETEDGRKFTSNDIHPIYLIEDRHYVRAAKLHQRWLGGETLTFFTEDKQQVKVVKITKYMHAEPVYNVHVLGPHDQGLVETDIGHNYFVDGVMVHNNMSAKQPNSGTELN
jgi:hypothetical protein